MGKYQDFHKRSIENRDDFWAEQAQLVDWQTPYTKVCDFSRPPFVKWFSGGKTNLCHNAVDRHAAKRPNDRALVCTLHRLPAGRRAIPPAAVRAADSRRAARRVRRRYQADRRSADRVRARPSPSNTSSAPPPASSRSLDFIRAAAHPSERAKTATEPCICDGARGRR